MRNSSVFYCVAAIELCKVFAFILNLSQKYGKIKKINIEELDNVNEYQITLKGSEKDEEWGRRR